MNEYVMRVLFGAQKQALRQNEAVAVFVEDYIKAGTPHVVLDSCKQVREAISSELEFLCEGSQPELSLSDKLFIQYILGMEAYDLMRSGGRLAISSTEIGEHGKVKFSLHKLPEFEEGAGIIYDEHVKATDRAKAQGSKEDEAWKLVEEMLSACPPAHREDLPDDDVLAAISMSKEYWKGMR